MCGRSETFVRVVWVLGVHGSAYVHVCVFQCQCICGKPLTVGLGKTRTVIVNRKIQV